MGFKSGGCAGHHSPKFLLFQPILDLFTGVFRVIILLKDDVRRIETMILQSKEKIAVRECQNLVESMPKRVRAVLKAKRGYTKY